jgi:GR25 family glycosyltransferase involved in LPS biosynthesis
MIDAYVINLQEDIDRWNQTQILFASKNINLIRVDAIKHEIGWIGCLLSHKKCIEFAKKNNMKNILVLEDDCKPLDNFSEFIRIKEEYLDKNEEWDIFLGGSVRTRKCNLEKVNDKYNLYLCPRAYGTFMICYNNKIYDFILNSDNSQQIDALWHKKIKCIIPVPFMCSTLNGISTVDKKYYSYDKLFFENQQKIIKYIKKKFEKESY